MIDFHIFVKKISLILYKGLLMHTHASINDCMFFHVTYKKLKISLFHW